MESLRSDGRPMSFRLIRGVAPSPGGMRTHPAAPHQFEAFLGSCRASGARVRSVGSVASPKRATHVRYLLVEAGWRILRTKGDETAALRAWAPRIAVRRGKRIAVALAWRLAGILYAMWRDNVAYDPARLRGPESRPVRDRLTAGRRSAAPDRGD
jgi:hypothetical protein